MVLEQAGFSQSTGFLWLAGLHKLLTMDKLKKRNVVIVNGCPMCLANEETTAHLLIRCSYASKVWGAVLKDLVCYGLFQG